MAGCGIRPAETNGGVAAIQRETLALFHRRGIWYTPRLKNRLQHATYGPVLFWRIQVRASCCLF
jgi:hypothetical protein